VFFYNNCPKHLLTDLENFPLSDMGDDEKIDGAAARILKRFKPAFEEFTK